MSNSRKLDSAAIDLSGLSQKLIKLRQNYDKPGGCDVESIEVEVAAIGRELRELGQELLNWKG